MGSGYSVLKNKRNKSPQLKKMTPKDNINREREVYKVTIIGSIVNFILVVFKFTAGILGNSAAMIADAVHSLSLLD